MEFVCVLTLVAPSRMPRGTRPLPTSCKAMPYRNRSGRNSAAPGGPDGPPSWSCLDEFSDSRPSGAEGLTGRGADGQPGYCRIGPRRAVSRWSTSLPSIRQHVAQDLGGSLSLDRRDRRMSACTLRIVDPPVKPRGFPSPHHTTPTGGSSATLSQAHRRLQGGWSWVRTECW